MKQACRDGGDIAIVGIGCRFPGGVETPSQFWDLLVTGRDGIVDMPEGRWDVRRFCDPDPAQPGRVYVARGGFLQQDIRLFDPLFFGISPREADMLDPQQRLLLEVAWEAFDNAGLDADRLIASNTGVYVAGFMMDSMVTQLSPLNRDAIGPHTAVGFTLAMLANRISYTFDLRGPSISIDTACSGSLVATHLACQALWNGECDMVIVGGVNVMHRPEVTMAMCKGKFLAKDGRSKSFDATGDGYGRGEGAGVVILKPLARALADGDRIYATIRASGVNQDGRTDGITVPNPVAQATLIAQVYASVEADARDVRLIEAHGTGTAVGDPLEARALGEAVGKGRGAAERCPVGSVKANIGHLEAAAGVASVIKVALSLHQDTVVPVANLKVPNPAIAFDELGLRLPTQAEALPHDERPCLAGINSFGYGGTNAHVLMQRFDEPRLAQPCDAKAPYLLVASARDATALKSYVTALRDSVAARPARDFVDIVYSSARRRTHHPHRFAVVTDSREHALEHLGGWLSQGFDAAVTEGQAPTHSTPAPVFVFTGMGPQWWGMGQQLYREAPVFRAFADRCDDIFRSLTGWSIVQEMQAKEGASRMAETQIAQPANFVLQAGLAELWRAHGIVPAAIVGHSVGEVTAGYVAGCYDLHDAIRISYHRGRIQKQAAGKGGMLALGCSEANALAMAAPYAGLVSLAAVNSPSSITLAGDLEALGRIAAAAEAQGRFNRMLKVEVPYHSPAMEPLKEETRAVLAELRVSAPSMPLYSSVYGKRVESAVHGAEYWCDNIREPVAFARAFTALVQDGHHLFLEVGPHPVLSSAMQQTLSSIGEQAGLLASLRRGEDEPTLFNKALGELYCAGCPVDWARIYVQGRFLELPAYPWQRREHWHETEMGRADRLGAVVHPLLQRRVDAADHAWESSLNTRYLPFIPDHVVQGLVLLPGAAYVEAALAAQQQVNAGGACVIERLSFRRALVIDAGSESELRVEASDAGAVRIFSRTRGRQAAWALNADGRIASRVPRAPTESHHAATLQRCTESRSVRDHYADMLQRGLQYGPAFQGIAELWRCKGEVLARVLETTPSAGARLNPAMLDACFQALLALMPSDSGTYVPTRIRRLTYHRRPGKDMWCHARIVRSLSGSIEADLQLYDECGSIAEIAGLVCQALPETSSTQRDLTLDWTYKSIWEASPSPARSLERASCLVAGPSTSVRQLADALGTQPGISSLGVPLDGDEGLLGLRSERLLRSLEQALPSREANDSRVTERYVIVLDVGGAADWPKPDVQPMNLLLQVFQYLARAGLTGANAPRVYLLTRDAHAVVPTDGPTPSLGALIGLMRVAGTEYPALRPCVIDLGINDDAVPAVLAEVLGDSAEDGAAWRGGVRHVQRLTRHSLATGAEGQARWQPIERDTAFVLGLGRTQESDTLEASSSARAAIAVGEIELCVDAVSVSTSDIAALTSARSNAQEEGGFGSVAAGSVTRIGEGVQGFNVGDRLVVIGCPAAARRYLPCDPKAVYTLPIPDGMTPERAVVLPLPYLAALHSLEQLAQLRAGETVLVHHALGATAFAAIQVARSRDARVIATVRGQQAAEQLAGLAETIDVDQFEVDTRVASLTQGRGVDVIVAPENEVTESELSALADFGRLVLLRDHKERSQTLPLPADRRDFALMVTDIEQLLVARRSRVRKLLGQTARHIAQASFHPLPQRTFGLNELQECFDCVRHGDWVGGVAIDLTQAAQARSRVIEPPRTLFRKDGSYLITGAFGGFGQALARWMGSHGAGELLLVSRRGEGDPAAPSVRRALESLGCRVAIHAIDVSDVAALKLLVQSTTLPGHLPLRGVMHTAAVLDDAPLAELDAGRFERVFSAKVLGAWHLHDVTKSSPLEHFVLFSSVSALIGNAGQGNYVAANCVLDSLAQHRRHCGLPATSVNWGALRDAGMAASSDELARYLESIGMRPFSAEDALRVLGRVLTADESVIGILDMDWQRWKLATPETASLPRFSQLVSAEVVALAPEVQAARDELRSLEPEAQQDWVCNHLVTAVARVMRLPAERVVPELSLPKLGMDSLMNMDLVVAIQRQLGVDMGALELMQGGNLREIAQLVLTRIGGDDSAARADTRSANGQGAPVSREETLLQNLGTLDDAAVAKLLHALA
jgi:acyl transferase domain-containing protein/NAD(P)-dependent dehydrogenase (short-subunit alcohol dehydrogenase family)/acyl carrier protein